MRCSQEAREAFEDIYALGKKVIVAQAAQGKVDREAEIEDAGERLDARWDTGFFEECVQGAYEGGGFCSQLLLKLQALFAEMLKHRFYGSKSEGVTYKRAGEESHPDGRVGVITELPCAAVECVHEL